jgi:5-methylcytosine-specific restriction endonuclease McrA
VLRNGRILGTPRPPARAQTRRLPITISYGEQMIRRAEFTPAVKQQALLRAAYRCERCDTRAELVHHRCHRADRSLFNCEVLCVQCHQGEHAQWRHIAGSAQRAAARAQGIG